MRDSHDKTPLYINVSRACFFFVLFFFVGNNLVEKRRLEEKVRDPNREIKALKRGEQTSRY